MCFFHIFYVVFYLLIFLADDFLPKVPTGKDSFNELLKEL